MLAGLPAAPLLGSLVACGVGSLAGWPLRFPAWLNRCVLAYVGLHIGTALEPGAYTALLMWLPSLIGLALSLLTSLLIVSLILRHFGHHSRKTAFYSAYPGQVSLVIPAASQDGADVPVVTMVQAIRVITLAALVPFALGPFGITPSLEAPEPTDWWGVAIVAMAAFAGVAVALRLRITAPWLIGATIGAAFASLGGIDPGDLPSPAASIAMILIGAMIGTRLAGIRLRMLWQLFPVSLLGITIAVFVACAYALPVSTFAGIPMPQLVLAYAPGGADVMTMLAVATSEDPAFVGIHHLVRVLLMALVLPLCRGRLASD